MSGDEVYRETLIDPHAFDPPPAYYGAAETIAEQYAAGGHRLTRLAVRERHGRARDGAAREVPLRAPDAVGVRDLINLRRELRSWKYKCDKEGQARSRRTPSRTTTTTCSTG
jgi:hypothetical protein